MIDIRESTNQKDFIHYSTSEIQDEFLFPNVFSADQVSAVYYLSDRIVIMGCMPVSDTVSINQDFGAYFGSEYFLSNRELGIINIGGTGTVYIDSGGYKLSYEDALYIAKDTKKVIFSSDDPVCPAKFYMVSTPAHQSFKTTFISASQVSGRTIGKPDSANQREIFQYFDPYIVQTCQLSMGMTKLKSGSVWNTMPPHTHLRRTEVYFYYNLSAENIVLHLMGEPCNTRHIVVANEQAVISPPWSIHAGCGTYAYSFIWAMGGENKVYNDIDGVDLKYLK